LTATNAGLRLVVREWTPRSRFLYIESRRCDMAKNTGHGYRKGAVKGRVQTAGRNGWTKRTSTGRALGTKRSPWKGVRTKTK
jgi:hypothetical protein